MWNWMHGYGAHGYGMHAGYVWLWPVLLLGLVVWVVWVTSRSLPERRHEESAEELLKRRYAAGEIDDEEYRRRREQLRHV
jgi:putative membrane protein